MKLPEVDGVLVRAAKTTAIVMFLCAGAQVASYMITLGHARRADAWLGPLVESPRLLMLVMMVLVLIGTALDLAPTILIFADLMPVVKAGIDPVYFGLMFILNGAIGLITPPVGTVLNVVAGVGRFSMTEVIKGVRPFLFAQLTALATITLFPWLFPVIGRPFGALNAHLIRFQPGYFDEQPHSPVPARRAPLSRARNGRPGHAPRLPGGAGARA